jgi:uncharacterized lipoprotein YajG
MKTTKSLLLAAAALLALASCTIEPTVVAPAYTPEVTTQRTTQTVDPIRVRLSHNALTDSELKRKKVRIMC